LIASETGTLHFTAVPPQIFERIARHAPTESGRVGGTAVTSKFYERWDNLPAQGRGVGANAEMPAVA
jgi:hypothetical protein